MEEVSLLDKDNNLDIEKLKMRIDSSLNVFRSSDLRGVDGINELCFKAIVIGIFSYDVLKGNVNIVSEYNVTKKSTRQQGYIDLYLKIMKTNEILLFELKYLSLAYAIDLGPRVLSLRNPFQLMNQLNERKENFKNKLGDKDIDIKKEQKYQVIDNKNIYKDKLRENNIPVNGRTNDNKQYFLELTVEHMIFLAKQQILDYEIQNPCKRYVLIGSGNIVFIEKI